MKQRVISSVVGLGILVTVMIFLDTYFLNIIIGIVGIIAVLELLRATGCLQHKELRVLSVLIASAIPFAQEHVVKSLMPPIMFILVIVMFIIMIRKHQDMRVEQVAMTFFFSIFVPLFFSCAIYMRNLHGAAVGGFYILWALGCGWLSDTGAYFAGRAFGKHKLAPVISPKKTVEGAIGGVLTACVGMILLGMLYQFLMKSWLGPIEINYLLVVAITPFISSLGILGDLSASIIKRQFGVKDYGDIMPGHGGVMDRFDSVLFTLPTIFIVLRHIIVAVPV